MISIRFADEMPTDAQAIVIPVAKDALTASDLPLEQAELLGDAAARLDFKGGAGALCGTWVKEKGMLVYALLLGIGEGAQADLLKAGGKLFTGLKAQNISSAVLDARSVDDTAGAVIAHGARLRSWRIDRYKTKKDKSVPLEEIAVLGANNADWARLEAVAEGVAFTRDLVSEPANIIYPESFVERCREMAEYGIELTVLDEQQMRDLGMGALLGVAQGSVREPRIIAMRWNGAEKADEKPLVLIGKGVTFDSGGISIKPAAGMEDMKWDMGGAGVVSGLMKALAGRKAKCHVVGAVGLVENMPDGKATRPGDIVKSMSGQTIEILNTDAEGRLVLADVLHYVNDKYKPKFMVDLATLTGAIIVSLGHERAGLFANDDKLADAIFKAGETIGERVWRLPVGEEYDKDINCDAADMKNIGSGRGAGSIIAAQFLQRFVGKTPWAHLDIAGVTWSKRELPLAARGGTAFGVRLLEKFVADNYE